MVFCLMNLLSLGHCTLFRIKNESSSYIKNYHNEDIHIHYNLTPIIEPFFKSRKITIEWSNKIYASSAWAKRLFDPTLLGTKPDFTITMTNPKRYIKLLIGEVNPPNTTDALIEEDLISLRKVMKNALDKLIEDGVSDLVICGLQVIGK